MFSYVIKACIYHSHVFESVSLEKLPPAIVAGHCRRMPVLVNSGYLIPHRVADHVPPNDNTTHFWTCPSVTTDRHRWDSSKHEALGIFTSTAPKLHRDLCKSGDPVA